MRRDLASSSSVVESSSRTTRGTSGIALQSRWGVTLQLQVHKPRHINLLELEGVFRTLEQVTGSGVRRARILILVDSQVTLGAVSKGRSSSRRVNYWLRRIGGLCLSYGLSVGLVWIPTKANPADAPSRMVSLQEWWSEVDDLLRGSSSVPVEVFPHESVTSGAETELHLLGPPYPGGSVEKDPAAHSSAA